MPRIDFYHETVKTALVKDGWTITDDPMPLYFEPKNLFVDLGGEKVISVQKGATKIAIEIKNFLAPSYMNELEKAVGQYIVYQIILAKDKPDVKLYLGVEKSAFEQIFSQGIGNAIREHIQMKIMVFDADKEEIIEWTTEPL